MGIHSGGGTLFSSHLQDGAEADIVCQFQLKLQCSGHIASNRQAIAVGRFSFEMVFGILLADSNVRALESPILLYTSSTVI